MLSWLSDMADGEYLRSLSTPTSSFIKHNLSVERPKTLTLIEDSLRRVFTAHRVWPNFNVGRSFFLVTRHAS